MLLRKAKLENDLVTNAVQLLTARVVGLKKDSGADPQLILDILVKNITDVKEVHVYWSEGEFFWQQVQAEYHYRSGESFERWSAHILLNNHSSIADIPRYISLKLQYIAAEKVFWDAGKITEYRVKTSGEVLTGPGVHVLVIDHIPRYSGNSCQLKAVASPSALKRMFARWSTDNWRSFHQTPLRCLPAQTCRNRSSGASTDNHAPQLWEARIRTKSCQPLQYAICGRTEQGEIWDNNLGINYHSQQESLKVMTLNLHCMQEDDQFEKFKEIAKAIKEKQIDVACLQEVGENWNGVSGCWSTNAGKILQDLLAELDLAYYLYFDCSHIGFSAYLEGCAVLSRFPFIKTDSTYISQDVDIHNIHSRKAVMCRIQCPEIGLVDIYSVHLSWWDKGFSYQMDRLFKWIDKSEQSNGGSAILLCGDFNVKAGSAGYLQVIDKGEYEDQYLKAVSPVLFSCIFSGNLLDRELLLAEDHRIDYIFAHKKNSFRPVSAELLFEGRQYKRVSDHPGYLLEFKAFTYFSSSQIQHSREKYSYLR